MRSFKKIAAMIMAVAMLCSFTALAADVTLLEVADTNSDNPVVTLGYDWDATTAAQTTMVLYKGAIENGDISYIDQFAAGANAVELNLGNAYGSYVLMAGGMDVATAVTEEFEYEKLAYAVTVTKNEGGRIVHNYTDAELADVAKGTTLSFEVLPFIGYEIDTITVNGEEVTGIVKTGYVITAVINDNTEIAVTFAQPAVEEETHAAYTDSEIHDLPADVFGEDAEDADDSKLAFGKVVGNDIVEAGMFLEKHDGTEFVPYASDRTVKFGPYFKAENITEAGEYGIRFVRFAAGTYRVSSYIKYGDGQYAYGAARVFTVE